MHPLFQSFEEISHPPQFDATFEMENVKLYHCCIIKYL